MLAILLHVTKWECFRNIINYPFPDFEAPASPAASARDHSKTTSSDKKVSNSGARGDFGRYAGKFFRAIRSTLGLFVMLVLYTVAGAFVFRAIESPHEKEIVRNMIDSRERMVDKLWKLVRTTNQSQDIWIESVNEVVMQYEKVISEAYKNGVSTNTSDVWNIYGALFFCGTVYTTIGDVIHVFFT